MYDRDRTIKLYQFKLKERQYKLSPADGFWNGGLSTHSVAAGTGPIELFGLVINNARTIICSWISRKFVFSRMSCVSSVYFEQYYFC